jgi:hypothetical protein
MNKKLFKFVEGHPDDGPGVNQIKTIGDDEAVTASKMVEPVAPGQYIDIVKDFKWTKTGRHSEGRNNTPAVELEEYYVTEPAFWSNLRTAFETLKGMTAQSLRSANDILQLMLPQSITSLLSAGEDIIKGAADDITDTSFFNTETITGPAYLKSYENTYGVKRTKFKYKLPYLENNYKNIRNRWQDGTELNRQFFGPGIDFIETMMNIQSPGVGIDWTKSFKYDNTPPQHTIKFFLDNTKDSDYSGEVISIKEGDGNVGDTATREVIPNYVTNFRFIFLLLYQNLPNRLNKAAIAPPVIYRAKLPGVFSYRYCFFDNIRVNMVGVRKTKEIDLFEHGSSNVIIPEGYEIELSIQSLVPESQNLYYDAIANPVTSGEIGAPAPWL